MEKLQQLQQRPSGGGAKLGTLDMQSYLEVMGRQLAEIQAQHQQFYASRPERYSRAVAAAKEPGQERRVHRSSSAVSPSSAHKPEGHTPDTHAGTPSSGESGQAGGSASSARRSLVFADGISDVTDHGSKPAGRNAKSEGHAMLRTSLSSPPPISGLSMDEEAAAVSKAPAANAAARPRRQPAAGAGQSLLAQAQAQSSQAARARARTPPRASAPGVSPRQYSASTTGVSPSLSPSSVGASFRPDLSNPGTPSSVATSSHLASVAAGLTPRDGTPPASARARAGTDSSVDSSPALGRGLGLGGGGSYAVYNAEAGAISGVVGYGATPESQSGAAAGQLPGGRRAHTAASAGASSISTSQSRSAWTTPREGAGTASAAAGAAGATPSSVATSALTASAMSSALAVHNEPSARMRASGARAGARAGGEDTVSEEEGLPHPLALAGRAFDGIDSEEDDDEDGVEDAVSRPELTAAAAAAQRGHGRSSRQPAASGEYAASFNFAAAGLTADGFGPGSARASGLGASSRAPGLASGQPGPRPALEAASLETEEALRALLGSPRPAAPQVSGGLSSSLDGGVPEDVLAALAKTDAGGLDAALGAAVATLVRQHAASLGVHAPAGRPSTQGQGASFSSHASPGGAAAAAGVRHAAFMGPGALTAAPAALPLGVAGRGFDSSLRSAGGAPGASPGGGAAAANAGRGLALHGAAPAVDASISLDQIDQLARTMVIDADTAALMRASVVAAATAMAEQRAAAAAHQQPVLYSMGPTRVSDPGQAAPELAAVGAGGAAGANAGSRPGTAARGPLSPSVASSVGKPGGDGDSVLYGSPHRRGAAATAAAPADGQAPPSVAPSPYVPPSPPPGADPSPYMASPIGHAISRLQHNSREDEEPAADVKAKPAANRPGGGSDDGAGRPSGLTVNVGAAMAAGGVARAGAGSASTPSGAPDGIHRRPSNTASGSSYDLSLTAAAAVGASRSGSASASRAAGPTSSRAAPLSHANTPTGGAAGAQPGQPVFSSFSLANLSPTSASAAAGAQGARASAGGAKLMASYDLGIDEAGKPASPGASPWPGSLEAGDTAVGASAARTSAHAAQPPAASLPVAAFSRAAAMAAAADVGLAAPPPPAAKRRTSQGGLAAAAGHSAASMETAARASAAGAGAGGSREPAAAGQNAVGGSSVVSSAAKLSQLKARRQQQWQSQVNASVAADSHGTPQPANANSARASAFNHVASDGAGASHHHTPHAPANSRNRASAEPSAVAATARSSAASPAPAPSAPGPAASPTPLLPEEVANAIVRAASSGVAASGELNLGHGISGLSVAIEAGAVKWAWQTGLKDGGASPGASQASPWASPGAGQAAAAAAVGAAAGGAGGKSGGESGEWGVQLPTPQWQRRGVTPPGSRPPAADGAEAEADEELARMEQEALQQRQQQWSAAQQQWEADLPGPQYRAPAGASAAAAQQQQQRRHTDHSMAMPESGAAASLAQPPREYATSAGGDAGLRPAGLSADAAGAASSKAAALLRLKRQSIMRHGLAGSQARDGEPAEFEPEPEASVAASIQGTNSQRSSRAVSAPIHRASQRAQQQQVPDGAPRVAYSRAWEQPEPVPEGDEAGDGEDAGGNQGPAPKPFLRRRSAKVQPKKVDWTHVKPRTNSRNPDYYGDQQEAYGAQYVPQYAQQYAAQLLQAKHVQHQQRISPRGGGANGDIQAILRQHPQQPPPQAQPQRSPMTSPRGAGGSAAKPPLNVNVGSRAWRPSGKSPTEDDRAAAGRRRSNIPPAPVPAYGDGGNPGVGAGGVSAARAGSAGGGPRGPPGANPLDDLLQHVNTLLKDFDKMVR